MRKKKVTPGASEAKQRSPRRKHPRTATGKKADSELRASAEEKSRAGARERTEEGHLMAGRIPPSRKHAGRAAGATRKVDDAIRTHTPVTEDEKLLQQPRMVLTSRGLIHGGSCGSWASSSKALIRSRRWR